MIRKKGKSNGVPSSAADTGGEKAVELEVRPGGMLVQKRSETDRESAPPAIIRVRVQFGSTSHQINISPQATFGELKKMLTGFTGLHHLDQKLIFKGKERESKEFLDVARVKDRSKVVLVEDVIARERRCLEMRKNARIEKASRLITEISSEVDMLANQVLELESVVSKGGKVAEKDVVSLTEQLMNHLVKLDEIMVDGDLKPRRTMQVRRVQQCVETLDMLKIKNSKPSKRRGKEPVRSKLRPSTKERLEPIQEEHPVQLHNKHSNKTRLVHEQHRRRDHHMNSNEAGLVSDQEQKKREVHRVHSDSPPVQREQKHVPEQQNQSSLRNTLPRTLVTMQWETFDSNTGLPATASTSAFTSSSSVSVHPEVRSDLL